MNCEQFENLMSDYLDQTLGASVRRQCAEHLIECRSCRWLLDDVRAALHLCHQAGWVKPLTDLTPALLRATAAGRMMSCTVFDSLILDYFDGFITASEFHVFQTHFDTCPRCQRLLRSIQVARELCQQVVPVEVPEGLHDRIMDMTLGANRRTGGQPPQGLTRRLARRLSAGLSKLQRSLVIPELVTAALLCLATLGLLLVEVSDDMSLKGIYREARLQIEQVLQGGAQPPSRANGIASNLQEMRARVSSLVQMGALFFSRVSDETSQTPSQLQLELKSAVQPPADRLQETPPRQSGEKKPRQEPAPE